jgi:hypothetical protein
MQQHRPIYIWPLLEFRGIEENTYHRVSKEIGIVVILFAGGFVLFVGCMFGHTVHSECSLGPVFLQRSLL